jgi:PilZ domain
MIHVDSGHLWGKGPTQGPKVGIRHHPMARSTEIGHGMRKYRFDYEEAPGRSIPRTGWRMGFDEPPGAAEALLAEPGDILGLFRAWDAVHRPLAARVADRRESDRYRPSETNAWIGWWQSDGFLVTHARLVNLSQGGAQVLVRHRPPMGQPVWLCLGAPRPIDYVQARVRDACAEPGRPGVRARLAFHLPCPAAFFIAAGREAG